MFSHLAFFVLLVLTYYYYYLFSWYNANDYESLLSQSVAFSLCSIVITLSASVVTPNGFSITRRKNVRSVYALFKIVYRVECFVPH